MHHYVYLSYTYSNASVFNVRKYIAKYWIKESSVITTRAPDNGKSLALLLEYDMTNA